MSMLQSAEFYTNVIQGRDVKLSAIREDEEILTGQVRMLKNEYDCRKREIDKIIMDFCDDRVGKIYERIGSMITTQRRLWNSLINSNIEKVGDFGKEMTRGEINELILSELEDIEQNYVDNAEYVSKIEADWDNIKRASEEGVRVSEEIDWKKIPEEELGKRLRGGEVLHRDEWIPGKDGGRRLSEADLRAHMSFGEMVMKEGRKAYEEGDLELSYTRYTQGVELLSWVRGESADSESARLDMYKRFLKNQSLLALKLGKYNDSIKSCNKVLEIDECDEKSLYRRAESYMMLGRYEEAKKDLRFICEFDYFSKEAKIQSRRRLVDMIKRTRHEKSVNRNIISKINGIMLDDREDHSRREAPPSGSELSANGRLLLEDRSENVRNADKIGRLSRDRDDGEGGPRFDLETTKDILEDLMFAYTSRDFEEELFEMRRAADYDEKRFIRRLRKILPRVNAPIYEKYGLDAGGSGYESARSKVELSVAHWKQRDREVSELSREIYKYIMGDTITE